MSSRSHLDPPTTSLSTCTHSLPAAGPVSTHKVQSPQLSIRPWVLRPREQEVVSHCQLRHQLTRIWVCWTVVETLLLEGGREGRGGEGRGGEGGREGGGEREGLIGGEGGEERGRD